jgi:asparagine synthase (glutamine-hydrolysing)
MCGICGFNFKDDKLLDSMKDALKHRGPDDEGSYSDGTISLGHRRLSIIDLSEAGHQPMCNDDRSVWITFNGEIYNYLELREELKELGHTFKSDSDTEVILHAYDEWGLDCMSKFNGMWAFAIYDKNLNRLVISRDRFGVKPLYYILTDKSLSFASEINALLKTGQPVDPNERLICDFLLYNITDHTNETFFKPILKLPKGHLGIYDLKTKKLEIRGWWALDFTKTEETTYQDAVKRFRDTFTDSVNLRLRSDVPVGSCLSGGMDSSSIVCVMDSLKKTEIKTFSAIFPGFRFDETRYIDLISSKKNLKNYKTEPNAPKLKEQIHDFIKSQGEPVPGPSPYSQYCVMELAKDNLMKVLLDGQGSDEMLAGYYDFYAFYLKGLLFQFRLIKLATEAYHLIRSVNRRLAATAILFLLAPHPLREKYFLNKTPINLDFYRRNRSAFLSKFVSCRNLKDAMAYNTNCKLEHLLKWEDRNSMAYSIETRLPFLDYRLAQLISHLPEDCIIHNSRTKSVLRDAMSSIVPDEITHRMDKIGFATPEDEWLREKEISDLLTEQFLNNEPLIKHYIDLEKTRKTIKQHLSREKNNGRTIWKILFLETWTKIFFNIAKS